MRTERSADIFWKQDWILDLDIRAFFDSVPHDLLLKAVAHHTSLRWVLLYIERWLKAPMQMPDGTLTAREKGTPQGSPISPLLANLFMHYAFDTWMGREYPGCPFERYADDIVAHCDSEAQARELRDSIARRLGALGLELHPGKTKVVYCKDTRRRGTSEHVSFDFLGYTFRGRVVRGQRGFFVGFNPAMSAKAAKAVSQKIRAWHLNRRSATDLSDLAREINPQVRGWIGYYGAFYRSRLYLIALRIDQHLVRWAMQKYKRLRGRPERAWAWLEAVRQHQPALFAHWHLLSAHQQPTCGGRMRRESHVRSLREREGEVPSRHSPVPHAGICAGGRSQERSLPQPAFYRSQMHFPAWRINEHLARWAMQKFKRFRGKYLRAMEWLQRMYRRQPALLAHWELVAFTARRTEGAG